MSTVALVLLSTLLLYCLKKFLDFRAAVKAIGYVACRTPCISLRRLLNGFAPGTIQGTGRCSQHGVFLGS